MADELSATTIREMVHLVDPDWEVRGARPAERGFSPVYHLVLDTPDGPRECYLKAGPEADDPGVVADARIQALLHDHTDIPVPEVVGAVDEHTEVPTPFYLMSPMPGHELSYEQVGWLSDEALRRLASQLGRHLGQLHGLDAVDAYGHVGAAPAREYVGERPAGDAADLAVTDGYDTWPDFLEAWVDRELERHESSPFADLTSELDAWFRGRLTHLSGPFEPVLGRNDHGLHNLLVDPETGKITAMLDWAYTLGVTPPFDVGYAVYIFGGSYLAGIDGVPDRRKLVRGELLAGYRETAPDLVETVGTRLQLSEVLAMTRIMNDFEQLEPKLPDGTSEDVADSLRADVESALADGSDGE